MLPKTLFLTLGLALGVTAVAMPGQQSQPRQDEISEEESAYGRSCGLKIAPCPEDMKCAPNEPTCTDMNRCLGYCTFKNEYRSCGGFRINPPPCPKGTECVDDPRMPWSCGMACDRPGICLPKKVKQCGGFAGLQCGKGKYCYDMPNDGCDPRSGGADCMGICM